MKKLSKNDKLELEVSRMRKMVTEYDEVIDKVVKRHLAVETFLNGVMKEVNVPGILVQLAGNYKRPNKAWNRYYKK